MADDSLMDRFETNARRFRARDAVAVVFVALFVLVLFQGESITKTGTKLEPGVQRDVVLAVGRPAGWLAAQLPLASAASSVTAGLSPDPALDDAAGFDAPTAGGVRGQVPVVTPDAFTPAMLGEKPAPRRPLQRVLVTGDSLSTPLDIELARSLAGKVEVTKEPKLGTGISKTGLVDWGKLSASQAEQYAPDAVVVFIGANEGFPMPDAAGKEQECCGAGWATTYANRARKMIDTYRRGGRTRVYWVSVMAPKDPDRQKIARAVNAAVAVAAEPWHAQVSVVDANAMFTPDGRYRDTVALDGEEQLVRDADGIHLNERGARVLADALLERMGRDYSF